MEDYGVARRLGATLGVMMKYGRDEVRNATTALSHGNATSHQQRIAYELLQAVTEH